VADVWWQILLGWPAAAVAAAVVWVIFKKGAGRL
jgi:hypothetical protein